MEIRAIKRDTKGVKLMLAKPRGFCAGVERAVEIVEQALALLGPPVYVRHEIVHNPFVVDDLRKKGAIFVSSEFEVQNLNQENRSCSLS